MARRSVTIHCAERGCPETALYEVRADADTVRDAIRRYVTNGFRDEDGVWSATGKHDDAIAALARLVEAAERTAEDEPRDDTPEMILRWMEVGMPPWGCHYCRGAEYGPDGVPCPACHGRSDEVAEPPLVTEIRNHVGAAEAERDALQAKYDKDVRTAMGAAERFRDQGIKDAAERDAALALLTRCERFLDAAGAHDDLLAAIRAALGGPATKEQP